MPQKRCNRVTLALILVTLLTNCSDKAELKLRQPVGILYVAVPELKIYEQPSTGAAVIATYREGESVTVYAMKGAWAEVQLFEDRTGWVQRNDLTAMKETFAGTDTPKFRKAPSPVWTQRKIRGEIVFEASVNTSGDVVSVRTVSNTTGDVGIEARNRAEIGSAKFYPLLRNGRPYPFIYEYRVSY